MINNSSQKLLKRPISLITWYQFLSVLYSRKCVKRIDHNNIIHSPKASLHQYFMYCLFLNWSISGQLGQYYVGWCLGFSSYQAIIIRNAGRQKCQSSGVHVLPTQGLLTYETPSTSSCQSSVLQSLNSSPKTVDSPITVWQKSQELVSARNLHNIMMGV